MKNKITAISLFICFLLICFSLVIQNDNKYAFAENYWDGSTQTYFASGSGTAEDPYMIENGGQLALLASIINNGNSSAVIYGGSVMEYSFLQLAYYKLSNNISLNDEIFSYNFDTDKVELTDGTNSSSFDAGSDIENYDGTINNWVAIGNNSFPFAGYFDGAGFNISGLYINTTEDYQGLFSTIGSSKGTIKNLGIVNSYIKGNSAVGAIVGHSCGGSVSNCFNQGIVVASNYYVGGIVGNNELQSKVTNCNNSGFIKGLSFYAGGIAGINDTESEILNCYNTSEINGITYMSGIVSYNKANSTVDSCYNAGAISGTQNRCAGIIAMNSESSVYNCYNYGTINATNWVGGIVAADISGTIKNCYNTNDVNGISCSGGVSGSCDSSTINNCYNTGAIYALQNYVGGVVGYFKSGTITDCYYLTGCATDYSAIQYGIGITTSGSSQEDTIGITTSFGTNSILTSAVTIDTIEYTNLLDSLNAWVNVESASYYSWKTEAGVNNDYPIFNECYISLNIIINGNENLGNEIVTIVSSEKTIELVKEDGLYLGTVKSDNYNLYINSINTGLNLSINNNFSGNIYLYSLVYNYNGGTGELPNTAYFAEGTQVSVEDSEVEKQGYSFVGFNTDIDGNTGLSNITIGAQKTNLYAVFILQAPQIQISDNANPYIFGQALSADYTHILKNESGSSIEYEWMINDISVSTDSTFIPLAQETEYEISCVATFSINGDSSTNTVSKLYKINKKELSVVGTSISDKTYDGDNICGITSDGSLSGLVAGFESVNFKSNALFENCTAATNKNVTVEYTLSGNDSSNYKVAKNYFSATIAPKLLVVNWLGENDSQTDFCWVYKNVPIAPFASVDTGIENETLELTVNGGAINAQESAYTATAVKTVSNNNFTLCGINKEFYILKADYADIIFENNSFDYDGNIHTLEISDLPTGLDGIQLSAQYSGTAKEVKDGEVTVTATFDTLSTNYNIPTPITAKVSINPRVVVLNWTTNLSLEYNKQAKTLSSQVLNLVLLDSCDINVALTDGFDNINAGPFKFTAISLSNINYTLVGCENIISQEFTITPKNVFVTADNKEIVFGQEDVELTYLSEGLLEGDSFVGELSREDGVEPGKYIINQGNLSTENINNYNIIYQNSIYTIKAVKIETEEKTDHNFPIAIVTYDQGIDPEAKLVLMKISSDELDPKFIISDEKNLIDAYELIILLDGERIPMTGEWIVKFAVPQGTDQDQECQILVLENEELVYKNVKAEDGFLTFNVIAQNEFVLVEDKEINTLFVKILLIIIIFEIVAIVLFFYSIKRTNHKLTIKLNKKIEAK